MAKHTALKTLIANTIKSNGNGEITGALLQNTLNNIVDSLGSNATFAGVATPTTNPDVPDGPVFYFATTPGTYTNFNNLRVLEDEIAIFINTSAGAWIKATEFTMSNVLAVDPMEPREQPDVPEYQRLFIDMWVKAWGKYGGYDAEATDGHPYLGNGLRMTYDEAIKVFIYSLPLKGRNPNDYAFSYPDVRTFIPKMTSGVSMNYFECCANCSSLEAFRFLSGYGDKDNVANLKNCFYGCKKLRTILGIIILGYNADVAYAFHACRDLEEVRISGIRTSISFESSSKLSLESLTYMIHEISKNANITITVHPTVYAKLTDETNTEWNQVLNDAMDKQITFTTTD